MTTFDWNDGDFLRRLAEAVDKGATEMAIIGADTAARSFGTDHGGVASLAGMAPNTQTGNLRNSIVYVTPQAKGTPGFAAYGTNLVYSRILEFGGTIRPKTAKALPVPINGAARAMLRKLNGRSLRTFKLVLTKRPGKEPILVEKTPTGRDKKNGAVFVLKRSVRIRPRPYLTPSLSSAADEMQTAFIQTAKAHLLGGA